MNKQEMQRLIAKSETPLFEAMQKIDCNTNGILFLVDCENRLIGCITDGDIRRFLLKGGKIDDSAIKAANLSPKVAQTIDEAKQLYHKKNYVVIPVVNEDGIIVNFYGVDEAVIRERKALNIPVVINAGGRGTRLDPFTKILPKPLIPVGELPIIEMVMKEYQTYNCTDFHIIVNYKRELMKAYFAESDSKYNISWYDEDKPLGTGGGLSLLKNKINSTFFFANCDTLLTANYEEMVQFHKENNNVITMICAYKNLTIPYGIVEMGLNGVIENMKEKPMMSFLTNTGIYIVEPEVLYDIEDGVAVDFPDIVEMERDKGKKVAVFPISENDWMDMGQLSELEKMRVKLYGK